MSKQIVAFNQCVKVYIDKYTYILNTDDGRYLFGAWAQYADKELVFKNKLKLHKGKLNKEYVLCFGIRCYINCEIISEINMKEDYGCDICGARKDYDEEIIWITSTYGVCEDCYNKLTNEDKDKIRNDFE